MGMRTRLIGDTRGASAIEHALILVLVALISSASWLLLGSAVEVEARCAAGAIAGGSPSCERGGETAGGDPMWGGHDRAIDIATREAPTPSSPPPATAAQGPAPQAATPPAPSPIDDLFAFGRGFVSGFVDGGVQTVTGTLALGGQVLGATADALTHPAETIATVVDVSTHLDQAVPAALEAGGAVVEGVWHGLEHAGDTLMHGTWEERGHLFGGATFEVASSVVPVSKLAKLGALERIVSHAGQDVLGAGLLQRLHLPLAAKRRSSAVDAEVVAAVDDAATAAAATGPRIRAAANFAYRDPEYLRLKELAGRNPVLFRGYNDTLAVDDVFRNGMAVEQHEYAVNFVGGGDFTMQSQLARSSRTYASASVDPMVAARYAKSGGHVFVLRGRGARDLRSAHMVQYDSVRHMRRQWLNQEDEWAMPRIDAEDVIGAYEIERRAGVPHGWAIVGDLIENPAFRAQVP